MDSLVGQALRTHCSFTGTEKCKGSLGHGLLHDFTDLQPFAIVEDETTIQRNLCILYPMACKVDYMAARKLRQDIVNRRRAFRGAQLDQKIARHKFLNALELKFGAWKWFTGSSIGLNDNHHLELVIDGGLIPKEGLY